MALPEVSVIIPVYNGAKYLDETIQSVLNQTYKNYELIIVDDASTDESPKIIERYREPRIKYIRHTENRGSNPTRITGLQSSSGRIIAFLDQDDIFHPDKLKSHVTFLEEHPDVGMSYNPHFDLHYSSKRIREMRRPPKTLTLADLLLDFPIAPSDMVFRREWILNWDLWNQDWCISGGEYLLCLLIFEGCKFARVDRALNYRRYHSGRLFTNLGLRCESELEAQRIIFEDPRCPKEVQDLRENAFSNTYLNFAYYAYNQGESDLGQKFVREAVRLKPALIEGIHCELVNFFVHHSIGDENRSHEEFIITTLNQFPAEIDWLASECEWAIAYGYLLKGTSAILWGINDEGQMHLNKASTLEAVIDKLFLFNVTENLMNYEAEFGVDSAEEFLRVFLPYVKKIGGRSSVRLLKGNYFVNRAFLKYEEKNFFLVMRNLMKAIINHPYYLSNRGVIAIMLRSIIANLNNVKPRNYLPAKHK